MIGQLNHVAIVVPDLAAARALYRDTLGASEPIDVAYLALYLACDESRRVTGAILPVDSGASAH